MVGRSLLFALLLYPLGMPAPAQAPTSTQAQPQAPRAAAPAAAGVAGRIRTREGAPVVAIRISAIVAAPPDARVEDGIQYYIDPPPVATTLSDAQGRFRLPTIPAGRYVIVAGIQGQATYYPATTEATSATVVTVGGPSRTDNLEITLVTHVGGRVRGTISPPPANARAEIAVLSGTRLSEILELPIATDGSFDFGHVPTGPYLLNFFPTPPGSRSLTFTVGTDDPAPIRYVRPATRAVTGRILVEKGPLPLALLAFRTDTSYVSATINPDGTFTTRLHAARHLTDIGGMPVGYDLRSVRVGTTDAARGFTVADADVSNVVITLKAPAVLPRLRGRVSGAPANATVEMTGPIVGKATTTVGADGTFEYPALVPGLYYLKIPQVSSMAPVPVVITSQGTNEVTVDAARTR